MNNIEKNLYTFYRIFECVKKGSLISENGFEVIDLGSSWPQIIFNVNQAGEPEKFIHKVSKAIETNGYPNFFIVPQNYINQKHTGLLKLNSIIPVKILTGMNIALEKREVFNASSNYELKIKIINFYKVIKIIF